MDAVDPDFLKKFSPFMSQDIIQDWSKKAHDLFESGGPGKVRNNMVTIVSRRYRNTFMIFLLTVLVNLMILLRSDMVL